MKKLFVLFISVLFFCSGFITASAEATYYTAGDLYQAWCDDLPDYICGVWSTDGGYDNLTFGIPDNESGLAGKEEILSAVENDSTLTFVFQVYSRNYLLQIQKEIDNEYFERDKGLVSTGLDDRKNCITLGILKEKRDNQETLDMIDEITGKYGNAVEVEYTDEIYLLTVEQNRIQQSQQSFYIVAVTAVVFLAGIALMFFSKRKSILVQTADGRIVSVKTHLSVKEVELMVKESDCDIPPELDKRIMNAFDEKK